APPGMGHDSGPGEDEERYRYGQVRAHSGMLSCFFQGFSSCLSLSLRRPSAMRRRVEWGMITSSMKPLLAATNGLAKRASYSAVRSAILAGSPISLRKMISTAPLAPITAISAVGQA